MNGAAWWFLTAAAIVAASDWLAVQRGDKAFEYVCKPLTMAMLVGFALTADVDNGAVRNWFVVALGLSLVGDVFLMLPRDRFVRGVAAFLLAHVAYVVGLWLDGVRLGFVAAGAAVAALAVVVVGRRIIGAVRAGEHPELVLPVLAYMTAISVMVASAVGTREPLAVGGAGLFFGSDAMIAWTRFVKTHGWHRLAIIATYHLAQAGLTLSLLT